MAVTQAEAAARAALLTVGSYRIFLDLVTREDAVLSRTEITFDCGTPGASTFADLAMPVVTGATLNGARLDPAKYVGNDRIRLDQLASQNTLVVEAEFGYSATGAGLSKFTDPDDGADYLVANCFPTSASMVFCCFDQPDLYATFEVEVRAPAGFECVANGAVTERPPAGQPGTWRFAPLRMKPYEFTLCAGGYVTHQGEEAADGIELIVRSRAALAGSPGLARVKDIVSRTVQCYQQVLGVPCPYAKLDIVFAPALGPLAMQLPGVMYVSEPMLQRLADPADDHPAVVLAHEVAHLWFGCLTEGGWWDDLWLAESMASYLGYLAGQRVLGQDQPWADMAMLGKASAYRADSLPSSQPVSSPVASAADALVRPTAITYSKGASAIRQLAALIGEQPLHEGLGSYLTRFAGRGSSYADLIECCGRASGRDLTGWAQQWLRERGVNMLLPDLKLAADGTIESLHIVQLPPAVGAPPGSTGLRTHRIGIGGYAWSAGRLQQTRQVQVLIDGERTEVPELAGANLAALILNAGDLTFAKVRFDNASWQALTECAMDVGDPLTETVCWNAAWDMTLAGELSAAAFVGIAARGISQGRPAHGLPELIDRAVTAANLYAPDPQRSPLLRHLADAAYAGAERAETGSRTQRVLAAGYAASADGEAQLAVVSGWQHGAGLPAGLAVDLELRAKILLALAAQGRATDEDLDGYAAADPANGAAILATCRARRPDPAAKQAAWQAALAAGERLRTAMAHAQGIWVPGQDRLLTPYRARFFAEALPALAGRDRRSAQRLARLLYPVQLADAETLAATNEALARHDLAPPLRPVLEEQAAIVTEIMAARVVNRSG